MPMMTLDEWSNGISSRGTAGPSHGTYRGLDCMAMVVVMEGFVIDGLKRGGKREGFQDG